MSAAVGRPSNKAIVSIIPPVSNRREIPNGKFTKMVQSNPHLFISGLHILSHLAFFGSIFWGHKLSMVTHSAEWYRPLGHIIEIAPMIMSTGIFIKLFETFSRTISDIGVEGKLRNLNLSSFGNEISSHYKWQKIALALGGTSLFLGTFLMPADISYYLFGAGIGLNVATITDSYSSAKAISIAVAFLRQNFPVDQPPAPVAASTKTASSQASAKPKTDPAKAKPLSTAPKTSSTKPQLAATKIKPPLVLLASKPQNKKT